MCLGVPLVVLDEARHIAQLPGGRIQVQLHVAEEIREFREMEGRSYRSEIESALGLSGGPPPQARRTRAKRSSFKPGRSERRADHSIPFCRLTVMSLSCSRLCHLPLALD